jgi:hypothetical protein
MKNRAWRGLKCTQCWNYTGFTSADLDKVMCKSYVKNYWCDVCGIYTNQDWAGPAYVIVNGEKLELELNFESVSNG